jgi:hypothetical protein
MYFNEYIHIMVTVSNRHGLLKYNWKWLVLARWWFVTSRWRYVMWMDLYTGICSVLCKMDVAPKIEKISLRYSDGLRAEPPGFDSPQGQDFLFSLSSRPVLGPTQRLIQWVAEALSPGVKRLWLEADGSPPSSAEVKNGGAIPPLP